MVFQKWALSDTFRRWCGAGLCYVRVRRMLTLTNKLCLLRWEHEHLHSSVVIIQCKTGYISFLEPKAGAVINSYRILALSEATHYIMIKHRRSFEITCTYDHHHKWPSSQMTITTYYHWTSYLDRANLKLKIRRSLPIPWLLTDGCRYNQTASNQTLPILLNERQTLYLAFHHCLLTMMDTIFALDWVRLCQISVIWVFRVIFWIIFTYGKSENHGKILQIRGGGPTILMYVMTSI